ncbi:MAG: hypothetical protein AB7U73_08215 [Pirellulales bacterium]
MKEFDRNALAIVGASPALRQRVPDPIVTNCEICGAPILICRAMHDMAVEKCTAGGIATMKVCWPCARPWQDMLAQEGGGAVCLDDETAAYVQGDVRARRKAQIEAN